MPDLDPEKLWLFLFFGVPGFVALKVYELFVPGRRPASQVIDVLTYGMLNLVVAGPILLFASRLEGALTRGWYMLSLVVLTALAVVVSPAALAFGVFRLRMLPTLQRWIQHPMSSAWDFLFQQRREWFLILHLHDGKMVGGRYGANSFASDAVGTGEGPDLYVEETWLLDETGQFVEKKPASILIRMSECRQIEFFEVQEEGPTENRNGEDNQT